jgi:hypothetical protein
MSTDRDVERIVRSWMDEGVTALPDRVLDLVLDQIPATPQRRAGWLARRLPPMNNMFRLGIAAAVVVVAAILGFTYLNNQVGTDTPTPTVIPSPTATQVTVNPIPAFGVQDGLEPGRYSLHIPDSTVSAVITVGPGWESGGWYIMNPPRFTKQVSFWVVGNVYQDPCVSGSLPNPPIGPTVDDLVAALDAQANTDMSPVVEMEVGGYPAKVVTMAKAEDVACDRNPLPYFATVLGLPGRDIDGPAGRDTVWIVDVDGHRIVIASSQGDPLDSDASTTILEVIDSVEFIVP